VNDLIARGEKMQEEYTTFTGYEVLLDSILSLEELENYNQWKLSCLNIIEVIAGKKSTFYEKFPYKYPNDYSQRVFPKAISHYLSVLKALKEELEMGFLFNVEMLVSKDILDTIVDEARKLLSAKYKDAAAIYCRVIIETFLKKLCDKNKITYRSKEKISTISERLRKKGHLSLSEWRQVQAWVDIGNAAAHGNFTEYSEGDVNNMLSGIESFVRTKISS